MPGELPLPLAGKVRIIDASSIIQIKHAVKASDQWRVLKALEALIDSGELAFPKEVGREVKEVAHPDAPGVWVHGVEDKVRYPDPIDETVREVLAFVSGVVDEEKEIDGDPYVLAMAKELQEAGHDVIVVTEDRIDRPPLISLATACRRLSISEESLDPLLESKGM